MNKKILLALIFILLSGQVFSGEFNIFWKQSTGDRVATTGTRYLFPTAYTVYTLNTSLLSGTLVNLPEDPAQATTIALPTPNGSFRDFHVWQTPMMEQGLAARYPGIKTFTATAIDNHTVTAKLDITHKGFHAMIYDGANTYFIDPYSNANDGNYIVYYKKDYQRTTLPQMSCGVTDEDDNLLNNALRVPGHQTNADMLNGTTKRTYRLALASTFEYGNAVDGPTPTKPGVLSAMVTSMNRVNGVYEREVAVTMVLIANNDDIIYLTASDPYTNGSGTTIVNENQTNIDIQIGNANYDIGHVFSTGAGGYAPGRVCNNSSKAKGATGQNNPVGDPFDIDYVAHEMGHQFSASHTFNASSSSCSGNGTSTSAYEPGSGSTIMAYAGICSFNNLQAHSDAYFHVRSLEQIITHITGSGNCATTSLTGNVPPVIPPFTQTYQIPFLTPFELTAPEAVDIDHDTLTYCWEQWNRGDFTQSFTQTRIFGPIFRSITPDTSRTRVFTKLDTLLDNVTNYLGEKLPDTGRWLTFRLTVRDILNGTGAVNTSDDSISVDVIYTGTPFKVTNPNTATSFLGGGPMTVTWDVSLTDQSPINCSQVDILLSEDGGYTWPHVLAAATANDGSETVTVPSVSTSTARLKIKGTGNIFFDLSDQDFSIITWPLNTGNLSAPGTIKIYPVPAADNITIESTETGPAALTVTNAIGQKIMETVFIQKATIPVKDWNRGVYYFTILQKDGSKTVRPVTVQ